MAFGPAVVVRGFLSTVMVLAALWPGSGSPAGEPSWLKLEQAQREQDLRLRHFRSVGKGSSDSRMRRAGEGRQLNELNVRQRQELQMTKPREIPTPTHESATARLQRQRFDAARRELLLEQRVQRSAFGP